MSELHGLRARNLRCRRQHGFKHGAGLILPPEILLAADIAAGRLAPVLPSHVPAARPVNIVYLRDRRPRRKLMSLVEYLIERMGKPVNA